MRIPATRRQPPLVFAVTRMLGAPEEDFAAWAVWLRAHADQTVAEASARRLQTNEPMRCAVLLPALATIPGPIALLEVGASAGLCLYPDRYSYRYRGSAGLTALDPADGPSTVRLDCDVTGEPPLVFAVTRMLGAPEAGFAAWAAWLRAHADQTVAEASVRRLQTNEPMRCAVLLPALATIPGPIALLEVGASAGRSAAHRCGSLVCRRRTDASATAASAWARSHAAHVGNASSGAPSMRVTAKTRGGCRRVAGIRARIAATSTSAATPRAQSA